jgi:hypothetical protein
MHYPHTPQRYPHGFAGFEPTQNDVAVEIEREAWLTSTPTDRRRDLGDWP